MNLQFISYGIVNDGGYRHESFLFQELSKHGLIKGTEIRKKRLYTDFFEHINLISTAFFNCDAAVNLVVSRMGVSSLLRNLFNSKKTIVIWHYHDESDGNGTALKLYFRFLLFLLRKSKKNKAALICVAPFWQQYFTNMVNNIDVPVFLFPNFFDADIYKKLKTTSKQKRIHLGQFSEKNFYGMVGLATKLIVKGYDVYYSTLHKEEEELDALIKIKYFSEFEDYLKHMAESNYTLALPAFNEGWNRVAHESILCGTTLIGFDKGGLGDLLRESNQYIGETEKQVLDLIEKGENRTPSVEFIDKYSPNKSMEYTKPILEWMQL